MDVSTVKTEVPAGEYRALLELARIGERSLAAELRLAIRRHLLHQVRVGRSGPETIAAVAAQTTVPS